MWLWRLVISAVTAWFIVRATDLARAATNDPTPSSEEKPTTASHAPAQRPAGPLPQIETAMHIGP
jgi:hypothetical protein